MTRWLVSVALDAWRSYVAAWSEACPPASGPGHRRVCGAGWVIEKTVAWFNGFRRLHGTSLGGGRTIPFTGGAVLCPHGWLPLAKVHRAR